MINKKKFNKSSHTLTILIAPLDWGLGHATRCIPIIKELISLRCNVIIGATGKSDILLKNEFPVLQFLNIPAYNIRYSRKKFLLPALMLLQAPRIFLSIIKEHVWLSKVISVYDIDGVISDNRFGVYNKNVFSVYMTHQLLIKSGNRFTEKIIQKLHYFFIKKNDICWIVDNKVNGLAGALSHVKKMPPSSKYIGPVSRFENADAIKKYDLLFSLSGPEPQRTIFENIILKQLKNYTKKVLLVRGLPGDTEKIISSNSNITIVNFLASDGMNQAFLQSEIIISRSGYTTIMDLVKIGRNAILVATPGQTEQEYLSRYLMNKKYFYSVEQRDFVLTDVLDELIKFSFVTFDSTMYEYKNAVKELVQSITLHQSV